MPNRRAWPLIAGSDPGAGIGRLVRCNRFHPFPVIAVEHGSIAQRSRFSRTVSTSAQSATTADRICWTRICWTRTPERSTRKLRRTDELFAPVAGRLVMGGVERRWGKVLPVDAGEPFPNAFFLWRPDFGGDPGG